MKKFHPAHTVASITEPASPNNSYLTRFRCSLEYIYPHIYITLLFAGAHGWKHHRDAPHANFYRRRKANDESKRAKIRTAPALALSLLCALFSRAARFYRQMEAARQKCAASLFIATVRVRNVSYCSTRPGLRDLFLREERTAAAVLFVCAKEAGYTGKVGCTVAAFCGAEKDFIFRFG